MWVPGVTLCMLALVAPCHHFHVIPLASPHVRMGKLVAKWFSNCALYAILCKNYAQNYALKLIMQNYALVIMLYAQLCKRALLMHRTMTNYAHYVTSYAIICPNYAQLCTIMHNYAPNYASLCLEMYSGQSTPNEP